MDNKTSNEEVVTDIIKELNINDNMREKDNNVKDEETDHSTTSPINEASENIRDDIPEDFEQSNTAAGSNILEDIDDETLRNLEESLSQVDKEEYKQQAIELKTKGNQEFKCENYIESVNSYTKALNTCPLSFQTDRSIFYCNRAAAKMKLNYNETAIDDCTKAIELNSNYLRPYVRRAKLYETTNKFDESLRDYTKILELDPSHSEARAATIRLPPIINERNEKLKEEMLGKLKDLGNMVLRPFGLSTDNFQMQQDPNTGGYSVNFQQNR